MSARQRRPYEQPVTVQDLRSKGIGSGDVAVILGLVGWKSPLSLYLEKRGEIPRNAPANEEAVHWGQELEPLVAKRYQTKTGRLLVDRAKKNLETGQRFDIRYSKEHPFMLANLDYEISPEPQSNVEAVPPPASGPGVYEGKTTNAFYGDEWDEEPPVTVQIQMQHQFIVTGFEWGSAAVLVGGNRFRWADLVPDPDFRSFWIEQAEEFWSRILSGHPPEPDGSKATREALRLLWKKDSGETVKLSPKGSELAHEWTTLKERISSAYKGLDEIEALMKWEMGDATWALTQDGLIKFQWKNYYKKAYTVPAHDERRFQRVKA